MCRVAEEQWIALGSRPGLLRASAFWLRQWFALIRASAGLYKHETGRGGGWTMNGFAQDLRHAARALVRRPGFTTLTVVTLGLGIGASTAIFSAVNAVILRPLPYAEADRVAVLFRADVTTGERHEGVGAANIRDFRERAGVLEDVAVAEPWSLDLQADGRVVSLRTWTVSRGFFDAIGAEAMLGRVFDDTDYDEGGSVVVLSHRAWTNRFSADPAMIGRSLALDGDARTVVGVMPRAYRFPDAAEAWIPRLAQPWDESARAADFMTGVARLAPGGTFEQAQAEADRIAQGLREGHPEVNADLAYHLVPLREHLIGNVRTPLFVIMAAVGFVLLIACANVAGLMLARGAQRERDFALRGALGAGTGRLMGTVVAESLLLAVAGCALGVMLTYAGVMAIRALGPDHLPRIDELSVDGMVLVFAVSVAALSAVFSGLAPSLRLSRPDLRGALGDGARGSFGSRAGGRARSRLVVAQVAGAVVLLTGAGLLLRSFGMLLDKELGFDPDEVLAAQIFAYDYETPEEAAAVVEQATDAIRAIAGVTGVAIGSDVPGATDGVIAKIDVTLPFVIDDRAPPPLGQEPIAALTRVTPEYFDVLGIGLTEGRAFDRGDNAQSARVIIVNEALARRHFGEGEALGERLVLGSDRSSTPWEIVGVVADTRPLGHASEPRPEVFLPLDQSPTGSLVFVVRAESDAAALTLPVMEAVWSANPAQSVYGATTMEALLEVWLKERRFNVLMLTAFSLIALLLSAVGLYGLISFSVERRIGELGIRRALGGRSGDLVGMVLGEGARLAGAGLVIGLAAAWYLSRFIRSMLFEIQPTDPLTFVALGAVVLVIASIATLVPAIRAVRVDPVEALRSE
jgi:putative ABC transport system permease protein